MFDQHKRMSIFTMLSSFQCCCTNVLNKNEPRHTKTLSSGHNICDCIYERMSGNIYIYMCVGGGGA